MFAISQASYQIFTHTNPSILPKSSPLLKKIARHLSTESTFRSTMTSQEMGLKEDSRCITNIQNSTNCNVHILQNAPNDPITFPTNSNAKQTFSSKTKKIGKKVLKGSLITGGVLTAALIAETIYVIVKHREELRQDPLENQLNTQSLLCAQAESFPNSDASEITQEQDLIKEIPQESPIDPFEQSVNRQILLAAQAENFADVLSKKIDQQELGEQFQSLNLNYHHESRENRAYGGTLIVGTVLSTLAVGFGILYNHNR